MTNDQNLHLILYSLSSFMKMLTTQMAKIITTALQWEFTYYTIALKHNHYLAISTKIAYKDFRTPQKLIN